MLPTSNVQLHLGVPVNALTRALPTYRHVNDDPQMTQPAGSALRAREIGEAINGHPELVNGVLAELAALLAVAKDDETSRATVRALSFVHDDRGAKLLLPLARAGHPDAEIREAVAAALSSGVETEGVREQVIAALVPMTADPAAGVRGWACFSLGLLDADSAEVREALVARLDDEHADGGKGRVLQASDGR
jgi:hypothetical protein